MRQSLPILFAALLLAPLSLVAQTSGCKDFDSQLQAATKALPAPETPGPEAFARFRKAAGAGTEDPRFASCLLRRYVIARYGDRMIKDLQEIVGFQTFEVQGKENWNLPEFVKQREWLEKRARGLGLEFKSYDGRMEEVILPSQTSPKPILALLTHGDVQGVEGQQWSSPPFEGKLVNGRIIGRGTEDDKGPIVAILYVLAALRDAGWPLDSTLKLLVANAEESSWAEIPYYLERAPMPERTIGVDAAYPVTHSQKGYGILTFKAQPLLAGTQPKPGKWRVIKMSGGSGMSIIPERGEALLEATGANPEDLSRAASAWAQAHPPAKISVSREGDHLKVTAEGRGGHSSAPASGHNALGDLTAFLATLDLRMDPWGALTAFTGNAVGTETDGRSLGLGHRDAVMGELTSNLSFLREDQGAPVAQVNIRYPRGIDKELMEKQLAGRAAAFSRQTGATIATDVNLSSQPHLAPAEGPLVSTLLAAWQEVTGKPGKPVAIGGGTQARLFPGGVDFGPAEDMVRYRGHGTDEYLTPEELHRIAELTMAAVVRLAGRSTS